MKKFLAKKLIAKYQPKLILVCGSWGKSMTVSAIQALLAKADQNVGYSSGVNDLASLIAGGGKKYSLIRALAYLLSFRIYPDVLIVETHGAVKAPEGLLKEIENKYVVIPYITQSDLHQSGGIKKYLQQNCFILKSFLKNIKVVFNADLPDLNQELAETAVKEKISYTMEKEGADFYASSIDYRFNDDAHLTNDNRVQGLALKIKNGGSTLPFRINGGVGKQQIYALLSAVALSKSLGINLVDSVAGLRDNGVLPGRLSLVPGIKKSLLVDDSYDIDLESALLTWQEAALLPLQEGEKRIAVIGEIEHAGVDSETAHCMLGTELADMNYDMIVAIGERCHDLIQCAKDAGFDESNLYHFMDKVEAGKFIQHEIKQGDLVVIKGSKEAQLETVVKELMAFPLRAKDDLILR